MVMPSVFGEIPGYEPESVFDSREEIRLAGLHRHPVNGISGDPAEGADAIVLARGYKDDLDFGTSVVYTGQGGQDGRKRQVRDQIMHEGNLALVRSEETGIPVRVIRGYQGDRNFSPTTGYRYDGLFTVVEHWREASSDGPLIWRYRLEQSDGGADWSALASGGATPPVGTARPTRSTSVVQRVVRSSAVTKWVKALHQDTCQICGIALRTAIGTYSEGAHVRALGSPHHGPDTPDNVLCLCPNDHVVFDKGGYYLDAGQVFRTHDDSLVGPLRMHGDHAIDWSHASYHREHVARSH